MRNLALLTILSSLIMIHADLLAQRHGGRGHRVVRSKTVVRTNGPMHGHHGKAAPLRYSRTKVVVVKQRRIRTVPVLPVGYATIGFRGRTHYYHGGYFYNYFGNAYNVIAPPIGIRIKVLPVGYRRIFIGQVPHYYYMGAYYKEVGSEYETVDPAAGTVVPELPEDNVDEVTIDGKTYYEFDNVLYKSIVTEEGVKYEVAGKLED